MPRSGNDRAEVTLPVAFARNSEESLASGHSGSTLLLEEIGPFTIAERVARQGPPPAPPFQYCSARVFPGGIFAGSGDSKPKRNVRSGVWLADATPIWGRSGFVRRSSERRGREIQTAGGEFSRGFFARARAAR